MERVKILPLLVCAACFLFQSKTFAQLPQRPLCVSQFALVNYACAALPYTPLPPPAPPAPPAPEPDRHGHSHGHHHRRRHRHHHHQSHSQKNCCRWLKELDDESSVPQRPLCLSQLALVNYACGKLPITPVGPPPPPFTILLPDDHQHRHHHHRHRHGYRHVPKQGQVQYGNGTPAEENCCRWLNDVDDECVCDLLLHLPSFLARPLHEYTVIVDNACNVTFSCGGRKL
ncbi:hypothetical protein K2173_003024 [Erythroxylum novogranatense]|uniref:Bifunctional inhibitor/plant lipid transfer protein/seed storage helical domain-containing protein n=1 Tax=Erythroxylum novogranatense TaxID=1862640 RepID=A0AAV8S862_9ROSI|nr:hypothetical protein K2173_003024 [Erythroxylum novogranatense]